MITTGRTGSDQHETGAQEQEAARHVRPVIPETQQNIGPFRGPRRRQLSFACLVAFCLAPLMNFASVDATADPIPGRYVYCGLRTPVKSDSGNRAKLDFKFFGNNNQCSIVSGEDAHGDETYESLFKRQWQSGKFGKHKKRIYRVDPGRLRALPKWMKLFADPGVEFVRGLSQGNDDARSVPNNPNILYRRLYKDNKSNSFLMRVPFIVAKDVFQWKDVTSRDIWRFVMKLWDDSNFKGSYAYMRNPRVRKNRKGNFIASATTDQTYYLLRFVLKINDVNPLDQSDPFDTVVFRDMVDPIISLKILDTEINREYRAKGLIAFDSVMQSVCTPDSLKIVCYGNVDYVKEHEIYFGSGLFVKEHLESINWIPDSESEPLIWQNDQLYLYGRSATILVKIENCASCNGFAIDAELSPHRKGTIKEGRHRAIEFWAENPRLRRMMLWKSAPDEYENQQDQLTAYEKESGLKVKYVVTSKETEIRSILTFTGKDLEMDPARAKLAEKETINPKLPVSLSGEEQQNEKSEIEEARREEARREEARREEARKEEARKEEARREEARKPTQVHECTITVSGLRPKNLDDLEIIAIYQSTSGQGNIRIQTDRDPNQQFPNNFTYYGTVPAKCADAKVEINVPFGYTARNLNEKKDGIIKTATTLKYNFVKRGLLLTYLKSKHDSEPETPNWLECQDEFPNASKRQCFIIDVTSYSEAETKIQKYYTKKHIKGVTEYVRLRLDKMEEDVRLRAVTASVGFQLQRNDVTRCQEKPFDRLSPVIIDANNDRNTKRLPAGQGKNQGIDMPKWAFLAYKSKYPELPKNIKSGKLNFRIEGIREYGLKVVGHGYDIETHHVKTILGTMERHVKYSFDPAYKPKGPRAGEKLNVYKRHFGKDGFMLQLNDQPSPDRGAKTSNQSFIASDCGVLSISSVSGDRYEKSAPRYWDSARDTPASTNVEFLIRPNYPLEKATLTFHTSVFGGCGANGCPLLPKRIGKTGTYIRIGGIDWPVEKSNRYKLDIFVPGWLPWNVKSLKAAQFDVGEVFSEKERKKPSERLLLNHVVDEKSREIKYVLRTPTERKLLIYYPVGKRDSYRRQFSDRPGRGQTLSDYQRAMPKLDQLLVNLAAAAKRETNGDINYYHDVYIRIGSEADFLLNFKKPYRLLADMELLARDSIWPDDMLSRDADALNFTSDTFDILFLTDRLRPRTRGIWCKLMQKELRFHNLHVISIIPRRELNAVRGEDVFKNAQVCDAKNNNSGANATISYVLSKSLLREANPDDRNVHHIEHIFSWPLVKEKLGLGEVPGN